MLLLISLQVLQLLRASLTSGNVLNDVFGKSIRDGYVLTAPHQEVISQHKSKPRESINFLQKRGQVLEDNPTKDATEIAHDWGRGLYSALREIQDTALHSSLVKYVKEREQRISSALRDLSFPEKSHSNRSSSNGTRPRHKKKSRANGSDFMPKPCKEMLMLEKQVDNVMARLCHLLSLGPSVDTPIGAMKPKPPAVKPPWTMYEPSSRIRLPFRGWHP